MVRKLGYTHWETFIYHGDEIEASSVSATYETKKNLSCLSSPQATVPEKVKFAVTIKTSDAGKKASLGIYVDGELELEWETNSTDYVLKTGAIDVSWTEGLHTMEAKLKVEAGGTAYNQLFEIYYSLRR
ncbi:unnamed protein product [marine sediment metagenome]|uniref:Uncharacterized protein n=1 Tax=marine sediment metagenome TaxID=412755 RepID=X1PW87_9ZZZZ